MPRETLVEGKGRVTAVLPRSLFRIEFANGHQILGFLSRRLRQENPRIAIGDQVMVELSPFDFSKGRIVAKE